MGNVTHVYMTSEAMIQRGIYAWYQMASRRFRTLSRPCSFSFTLSMNKFMFCYIVFVIYYGLFSK